MHLFQFTVEQEINLKYVDIEAKRLKKLRFASLQVLQVSETKTFNGLDIV